MVTTSKNIIFSTGLHRSCLSLAYTIKFCNYFAESGKRLRLNVPQIVYLARGDTLKLEPTSIDSLPSSYGKKYGTFWDFSPSSLKAQESEIRIIDSTFKRFDVRASLEQNGTVLILTNTTLNDSGVYHLRIVELYKTTLIHKEFHVIVEGIIPITYILRICCRLKLISG